MIDNPCNFIVIQSHLNCFKTGGALPDFIGLNFWLLLSPEIYIGGTYQGQLQQLNRGTLKNIGTIIRS